MTSINYVWPLSCVAKKFILDSAYINTHDKDVTAHDFLTDSHGHSTAVRPVTGYGWTVASVHPSLFHKHSNPYPSGALRLL